MPQVSPKQVGPKQTGPTKTGPTQTGPTQTGPKQAGPIRRLTLAQARRVALSAQGFGRERPGHEVGMRDVGRMIDRLGQFQIDTINIVQRAQYLPLFSRLGPYDIALLDRAAHRAPRKVFEYWGHAASLIDVNLEPALRWRMADAEARAWRGMVRTSKRYPELVETVLGEVARFGPIGSRAIEERVGAELPPRSRDNWGWNWSQVKSALEWLLWAGKVTSARRNSQFERLYDLPERVLPKAVSSTPTPAPDDAMVILVRRAARALGVASLRCLRDYFRLSAAGTVAAIAELVATGELIEVRVGDRSEPWWMWHEATVPRRIRARALLSPFDSLIFERARVESLFAFFYRIEIYVPEEKRIHGYYVYPFLLDDELVARVDLKAHRAAGFVEVRAAWIEPAAMHRCDEVAHALAAELGDLASWVGVDRVEVVDRGTLAQPLTRAFAALA